MYVCYYFIGDYMIYMCIDLKSFYASVECRERNLDPLTTNLVVADASRTEKTICLAATPSLKSFGIPGRARLFEVIQKVRKINYERKKKINYKRFTGKSCNIEELKNNPYLELDFITASPRMKLYMKYSTDIYNIYLNFISSRDILVYSIDEVFCDITHYLKYYKMSAIDLTRMIIKEVYNKTGITATAGIGTNMYLAKVAMDITAKHMNPDRTGARVAYLDETMYKKKLWNHRPLTDFWRVGKGYIKKLEDNNMYTMGDIARISINNEDLLFKLFGVNAEILIDHAWGVEPCTMKDAKEYKPISNSKSVGQVLHCPYDYKKAKIIIREMIDDLTLYLVSKKLVTDQLVLTVGYDITGVDDNYKGEIKIDSYGRSIPKHAHGTVNISHKTSSTNIITKEVLKLYDKIINKNLLIRRVNIAACNLIDENSDKVKNIKQLDLFSNDVLKIDEEIKLESKEKDVQNTIINIKNKYGKNAIVKGLDLLDGATTIDRNNQVGGHRA